LGYLAYGEQERRSSQWAGLLLEMKTRPISAPSELIISLFRSTLFTYFTKEEKCKIDDKIKSTSFSYNANANSKAPISPRAYNP